MSNDFSIGSFLELLTDSDKYIKAEINTNNGNLENGIADLIKDEATKLLRSGYDELDKNWIDPKTNKQVLNDGTDYFFKHLIIPGFVNLSFSLTKSFLNK